MSAEKKQQKYDASQITVLEGLEPVRVRPGTVSYTHLDVYKRQMMGSPLLFLLDYNSSIRILPLTPGYYTGMILKCRMNYLALVRVHRLKSNLSLGTLHLTGKPICKSNESLLSLSSVILGIHYHSCVSAVLLVDNETSQILNSIEGLSSLRCV